MKFCFKTRFIVCISAVFVILTISLMIVKIFESLTCENDPARSNNEYIDKADFHSFQGERVLHLDLKGAPPSINYLKNIFPLFYALGISSVLVEYEDIFPYRNKLLNAINAYSKDDIKTILRLAKKNHLKIIPLIQTFGHLEFMLKTGNFTHLREVDEDPQSICPSQNSTNSMIFDLLEEVIEAHPGINYIHIGCDEVYQLGVCKKCIEKMSVNRWNAEELFLDHVTRIAKFIRSKYPEIVPLIWDDQLRAISSEKMNNFEIGTLVEPVLWFYKPVVSLPFELWKKYAEVFPALWIASSFKGATGSAQILTNISYHVENQKSWMVIISKYSKLIKFRGVIITGWQRYNHFAVLCELLPVSIPSLAHVALVLDGKDSTRISISQKIRNVLACGVKWTFSDSCKFPGVNVYYSIIKFSRLKSDIDNVFSSSSVVGWFTSYNVKTKYFSQMLTSELSYKINDCQIILKRIEFLLRDTLATIYDKYTIFEWIETYVRPYTLKLNHMSSTLRNLNTVKVWEPRYANFVPLS